jgi:Zn-dependent protease with chaperone function
MHLWGIGMLFGSVVIMDLRILGVASKLNLSDLSRLGVLVALLGFGLAVLTGSLMFITQASELISSRLFILKMCLIFLLLANAIILRMRTVSNGISKVQALISLAGWASVIGMGRWLAYL